MSHYLNINRQSLFPGQGTADCNGATRDTKPTTPLSSLLKTWNERMQQRRTLATLPQALLNDIGISAEEAAREARKPFWVA